jgi:hypothetical protein
MLQRNLIREGVFELLEQPYLESVGPQAKQEWAELSDAERKEVLKNFLREIADDADQWAKRLHDIL